MSIELVTKVFYYTAVLFGIVGSLYITRYDWKRYGLLFCISGLTAVVLCYLFVYVGFYSFPNIPLHNLSIPVFSILVTFPVGVIFCVRYIPTQWKWKIPFYWGGIHVGFFFEFLIKTQTELFTFNYEWDLWDSYTWWWIYFLLFEWIGGKIIPPHVRRPIDGNQFQYGRYAWLIFHAIVIITIFMSGYYLGRITAS